VHAERSVAPQEARSGAQTETPPVVIAQQAPLQSPSAEQIGRHVGAGPTQTHASPDRQAGVQLRPAGAPGRQVYRSEGAQTERVPPATRSAISTQQPDGQSALVSQGAAQRTPSAPQSTQALSSAQDSLPH